MNRIANGTRSFSDNFSAWENVGDESPLSHATTFEGFTFASWLASSSSEKPARSRAHLTTGADT
ncbi:MAG TPA: hypothetical protein VN025_10805 [Candidatus Dormibacteraeota bacterium]|nr:hypothetical protein [Candidatus Dormibacteraeota bacterium]